MRSSFRFAIERTPSHKKLIKKSSFAEARALYDWVATHITYAGNCIGIGAVVPRDLPFVLDNRMGDCKDHATLLQALLAARGIKSTQALVNAVPKQMKVLSVPDNLKIANGFLSYTAAYKLKGNVLTVKRTLDDRTKGNVCSPQVMLEYKKFAEKAMDDLKSQVLYK